MRWQNGDGLSFPEVIVGFLFLDLRFRGDEEESRLARPLFVVHPNEMRACRDIVFNHHLHFSIIGSSNEVNARRVSPDFWGPGVEFADDLYGVRSAGLDSHGIQMIEDR